MVRVAYVMFECMAIEFVIFFLLASCHIRKIVGCACAENVGNVFPTTMGTRSRHASRHVRDARAVMHAGVAN